MLSISRNLESKSLPRQKLHLPYNHSLEFGTRIGAPLQDVDRVPAAEDALVRDVQKQFVHLCLYVSGLV